MPRIRALKPEFFSSPDTAACKDPWGRLLFEAMWLWADDTGRGTANPKELAGFAFPNDDWIGPAEVRRMLGEIHRAFGVVFYKIGKRSYYAIPSWDNHQKIDRRSGAKHPAPENGVPYDPTDEQAADQQESPDSGNPIEGSGDPVEDPSRARGDSGAGTGEQGNRGTGEVKDLAIADAPADMFEAFWAEYPRKDGKQAALKAWPKACKKLAPERLVAAAKYWAGLWAKAGVEKQFVPHASSWLNGERWDDEPPTPRGSPRNGHVPYRNPDNPDVYEESLL